MAEAIYVNGVFVKTGKFGLRVSINVDKFIEELQKHRNSKGYVNVDINPRKEPGKYGDTHSVKLDTWEPSASSSGNAVSNTGTGSDLMPQYTQDLPF